MSDKISVQYVLIPNKRIAYIIVFDTYLQFICLLIKIQLRKGQPQRPFCPTQPASLPFHLSITENEYWENNSFVPWNWSGGNVERVGGSFANWAWIGKREYQAFYTQMRKLRSCIRHGSSIAQKDGQTLKKYQKN